MRKAFVFETIVYGWTCPNCGAYNEECFEPNNGAHLFCTECEEECLSTYDIIEDGIYTEDIIKD